MVTIHFHCVEKSRIYLEMEGGEMNVNASFLVKCYILCKAEQYDNMYYESVVMNDI